MNSEPAAPTLLYVEDETLIQVLLVDELEKAGFCVMVSSSGLDALATLEQDHARIQGVITDINLGKGPDGWDVARAARALQGGLPIVYLSAASEHEWTSMGVPASVMIAKPFVPAQVVVAISSLLAVSD
jgi:DNA-binding response OmpR family regulator